MEEVVDGLDVLNQDLIPGINVSFGMDVIRHIEKSTSVMSQMLCHAMA